MFFEFYFNCPNIVIELLLQGDCGSELFGENVSEVVIIFYDCLLLELSCEKSFVLLVMILKTEIK